MTKMANKLNEFLSYLQEQVNNHSIYVWGAQGQTGITEDWIRKKETTKANGDRVVAYWKKQVNAGYGKVLRAFDCSGLGMYFLQNLSGICSSDMNANGLKSKCRKIAKSELKAGDFVFKVNSEGRATHVGYVVDSVPNVIEARGRDYGVVKGKLDSRWNAFGRPPFWNEGYVFTRVLKYSRRGEDVCELKKLLQSNGYGLNLHTTNKNYLSSTKSVVKAYQKANGLTVDGKAGKDTITKLGGTYNA